MALWWTKRSLPPSSGVMKPKPLSSLNHLTVPVAMCYLHGQSAANAAGAESNNGGRLHEYRRACARPNKANRSIAGGRHDAALASFVADALSPQHFATPLRARRTGGARGPGADRPDRRGRAHDRLRARLPGLAQVLRADDRAARVARD